MAAGRHFRRHHTHASPSNVIESELTARNDRDRLTAVLDQLIFLLDTEGVVPIAAEVDAGPEALRLSLRVTSTDNVEQIGAAPKAVALSGPGIRLRRLQMGMPRNDRRLAASSRGIPQTTRWPTQRPARAPWLLEQMRGAGDHLDVVRR